MIRFIGGLPAGLGGAAAGKFFCCSHVRCDSPAEFHVHGIYPRIYERYIEKEKGGLLKDLHDGVSHLGNFWYIITMLAFSGTSKSILAVIGSYISYISGPTCGIFLLAMLTKRPMTKERYAVL